jgi:hypothetical protein
MGVDFANVSADFLMVGARTVKDDTVYMDANRSSVDFPDTNLSASKTEKIKFFGFNLTASTTLTLEGTDAAEFSLDANTITAAQANAAEGKEITITFAPLTTAGEREAALRVTNATDNVSMVIPITGKGLEV